MDTSLETAIAAATRRLLAERRIVSDYDELTELVGAELDELDEPDLDPDLVEHVLLDVDEVYELSDGRLAFLPSLLEGLTLTCRLTEDGAGREGVPLGTDLAPLWLADVEDFPLPGGGAARIDRSPLPSDPDGVFPGADDWLLTGPSGWLGGAAVGELLAFSWGGGALHVTPTVPDEVAGKRAAARLRETYDAIGEEVTEVTDLVMDTVADHPGLFRGGLPPLSELLATAGLDTHGDWVAPHGFDWDAWRGEQELALYADELASRYDLDERGVSAAVVTIGAFLDFAEGGEINEEWRRDLAAVLGEPGVVEAFAGEVLDPDVPPRTRAAWGHGPEQVAAFAEDLLGAVRGAATAPVRWLLATCQEARGDVLAAERHLADALRADPDFPPALLDAATYAEDRGDAARALSYLRRAGVDDPAELERVTRFTRTPKVGRNDPCPCGSGRKHKACCLRHGGWPLPERAGWLYEKAVRFLTSPGQRHRLEGLVVGFDGAAGEAPPRPQLGAVLVDLGLFEGGGLRAFLDERGVLLPDDEGELARSWVGTRAGLYEVAETGPGEGVTLLDLRSGERQVVREGLSSQWLEPGETLWARVLPDGETHQLFGGPLDVPLRLRQPLLDLLDSDPDAEQLAAWFGAAEQPPRSSGWPPGEMWPASPIT